MGAFINSSEQTVTHGFKNYLLNFSVRHDEVRRGNDSLSNALAKKKRKRGEMEPMRQKSVMGGGREGGGRCVGFHGAVLSLYVYV